MFYADFLNRVYGDTSEMIEETGEFVSEFLKSIADYDVNTEESCYNAVAYEEFQSCYHTFCKVNGESEFQSKKELMVCHAMLEACADIANILTDSMDTKYYADYVGSDELHGAEIGGQLRMLCFDNKEEISMLMDSQGRQICRIFN